MSGSNTLRDEYFNDLSRQPPRQAVEQGARHHGPQETGEQSQKLKRIACVLCRRRKLKCDSEKPSCGTCVRLQHDCTYDEVRRKSGPKRGYVKALEARLAQVETLLKTQDATSPPRNDNAIEYTGAGPAESSHLYMPEMQNNIDMLPYMDGMDQQHDIPTQAQYPHTVLEGADFGHTGVLNEDPFPWEMISLGLDEPLPTQDVIDELNQVYFEKVHISMPMLHRTSYYAAMDLAPYVRPPICLRYAMWCNSAGVMEKYGSLQDHFYQRARKYIQQDEMKGHGESMITLAHCQTWILLSNYEFTHMFFPRAWMSAGRASRMALMMGLHRISSTGLDVKQCLPPPQDWTDMEERRRTFWACFCMDRYASIGTGWPMTIEEKDISTVLPSDELSYELSRPGKVVSLEDAMNPALASELSSLAGVALLACLFGRNLLHLHRPTGDENEHDLNGAFWKRHRHIENILRNTALTLPESLRLPAGLNDPNVVFLNMNIHTSAICLHQAAIFKADNARMPPHIAAESKVRCITAAAEIASIMRQISHVDITSIPFISFCLYVSARVFVQYLRARPKDSQVRASLQFLTLSLNSMKRKIPLAESFLVQLSVDMEVAGLAPFHVPAPQSAGAHLYSNMPPQHPGMQPTARESAPTYGDQGILAFTDSKPSRNVVIPFPEPVSTFGYVTGDISEFVPGSPAFDLPNRQRTQVPSVGSTLHVARSSHDAEMYTSPDGSGGRHTPGWSDVSQQNASSHSSHTGRSPETRLPDQQAMPQSDMGGFAGMFDPNNINMFGTDFDMPNVSSSTIAGSKTGVVMPQNWPHGSGLTPMHSGLTPGSGMGDMSGISDAAWSQVLDGFPSWDPGMGVEAQRQ